MDRKYFKTVINPDQLRNARHISDGQFLFPACPGWGSRIQGVKGAAARSARLCRATQEAPVWGPICRALEKVPLRGTAWNLTPLILSIQFSFSGKT
jgi:hypothetical protein